MHLSPAGCSFCNPGGGLPWAATICLLLVVVAGSPAAQAQRADSSVALHVEQAPLSAVLRRVQQEARVDLIYDPRLAEGRRVTCRVETQAVETLMQCVLKGTGLHHRRLPSGTLALLEEPVSRRDSAATVVTGFVHASVPVENPAGKGIAGASVRALASGRGTTTDASGFFRLALPAGPRASRRDTVVVAVSHVGYAPAQHTVLPADAGGEERPTTIRLRPAPVQLKPVSVKARADTGEPLTEDGRLPDWRGVLPPLLGEADLIDALQLLPGAQSEGAAGLRVRGSGREQNLVLLDGAPVYNPYHALGFLSVFSPSAVRGPAFRAGHFPARYGGRLASVLSFRTREGNPAAYGGSASLGLVSGQASVQGPVPGPPSGSFALSARRSFVSELAQPLLMGTESPVRFWDLNAGASYDLSARDRLRLTLYAGRDAYRSAGAGLAWGTKLATLSWDHAFGEHLDGRIRLFASDYDYRSLDRAELDAGEYGRAPSLVDFTSGVRDEGGRAELSYAPSSRHELRLGLALMRHRYRLGERALRQFTPSEGLVVNETLAPSFEHATTEWALYTEDKMHVSPRLHVDAGLRMSGLSTGNAFHTTFEPRVSAHYALSDALAAEGSYSRMAQYVHQVSSDVRGLPVDLWVPPASGVGPARAHQFTTGFSLDFGSGFEGTLEGYYKRMRGLARREDPGAAPAGDPWVDQIETGKGRSYGAELLLAKQGGATTGWVGYTLSRSTRTFEGSNEGEPFPFRYDRRHDLTLTLAHQFTNYFQLTGTWVYRTGGPAILPSQATTETEVRDAREGVRLPSYERLDVGARLNFSSGSIAHEFYLGVHNTYERASPFFVRFGEEVFSDYSLGGLYHNSREIADLPAVLPALRYTVTF